MRVRRGAGAAHQLRAQTGVAVVQGHRDVAVCADRRAYEGGNVKRARDPSEHSRTALRDACEANAAPVERGFDEERADALLGHGVHEELPAVRYRPREVCLGGSAHRVSADRGVGVAPVALQQAGDFRAVRGIHGTGGQQAVAGTPVPGDRLHTASHERPK
jgi:hypothetical protein